MQETAVKELMAKIAQGDKASFQSLIALYQEKALQIAYYHVSNWHDAEEIAQDAFINVFRKAKQFEGRAKFSTWFYRIVINRCHDHHRKKKWKKFVSISDDTEEGHRSVEFIVTDDPRKNVEDRETMQRLDAVVTELPLQQKTVFYLHYFEGKKLGEIAEVLGKSEGNIKANLFQAREKIKKRLKKAI